MTRLIYMFSLAMTAIMIPGCAIEIPGQKSYSLEVQRPEGPVLQSCASSIRIARFGASKLCGAKWLVYHKGDMQFETDYYNHFIVSPDQAIQNQTYQWFSSSGAWGDILKWNEFADVQYELKGDIKELYGDFSEKNNFKAIVKIEFLLVEKVTGEFLLKKIYCDEVPFKKKTPNALVSAYSCGIQKILTDLEAEVILAVRKGVTPKS